MQGRNFMSGFFNRRNWYLFSVRLTFSFRNAVPLLSEFCYHTVKATRVTQFCPSDSGISGHTLAPYDYKLAPHADF